MGVRVIKKDSTKTRVTYSYCREESRGTVTNIKEKRSQKVTSRKASLGSILKGEPRTKLERQGLGKHVTYIKELRNERRGEGKGGETLYSSVV